MNPRLEVLRLVAEMVGARRNNLHFINESKGPKLSLVSEKATLPETPWHTVLDRGTAQPWIQVIRVAAINTETQSEPPER
jgi:hypothetical protein